ncbi:RNA polymerase sigma factor [Amycolatopsis japonica]
MDDSPPDALLLGRLRDGDLGAGDLLFRRHSGPLRRIAAGWVRQPAEQDDLVAEAFARVLAAVRDGGGPRDELRPYLVVTMRNLAARWNRHRLRVQPHAVVPATEAAEGADGPALRASTDQLLRSAFRTLPVRWRAVLWSTVAEGHTPAELAPILGVSPNGVAALAHRARVGLREAYLQAQTPKVPMVREVIGRCSGPGVRRPIAAARVDDERARRTTVDRDKECRGTPQHSGETSG